MRKLWRLLRSKIVYRLLAIMIASASLPVLMFQMLAFREVFRAEENNYLLYKQKLNNQIVIGIEENLNALVRQSLAIYSHAADLSIMLSENPYQYGAEYTRSLNAIKEISESYLQGNNKIAGLTYFTLDGKVKLNTSRYVAVVNNVNSASEAWFQDALKSHGNSGFLGPHVPAYVDRRGTGGVVISLARAIIDFNSNKPIGVMVIDQNASEFWQESFNIELAADEQIAILDAQNQIVYANREPVSAFVEAIKLLGTAEADFLQASIGGKDVIVSTRHSEMYGWCALSILPQDTLRSRSDYIRQISRPLLWGALVLALLLSLVLSSALTRPLKKLKQRIERIQGGDLHSRVEVRGSDEIAQIGNAFNDMSEYLETLIKHNYESNLLKKHAELESLQSQINPHFLFNTLNSIKGFSDEAGSPQVSRMIKGLSDLFRYSLNRGSYIVSLREELSIIDKYLFLQAQRFEGRFDVVRRIDESVLDQKIIRLCLQPICENAFQHGLELKKERGELRITGWREGDRYFLEIANTGKLIEDQELETINALLALDPDQDREKIAERVGVFNVNARIKFHFGNRYGLHFAREDGFTIVRIALPFETEPASHPGD